MTISATPTIPLSTKANTLVSTLHVVLSTLYCEKKPPLIAVYDLVSQTVQSNNIDEQFKHQKVNQSLQEGTPRLLLYQGCK